MSVVVRPAHPTTEQLPRVVGGRAAAPEEWDAWREEPGHDLVAYEDSRVVGGIHISLVGRAEAWLENLRVHPEFQGRGMATRVVKEAEQVARRYGAVVARTAIPAHDYAGQAVAERGGFRRVLRCVVMETAVAPGPAHVPYDAPIDWPRLDRSADLWRFLERTTTLQGWERLLPLGWRFRRIVVALVEGLIKDQRAVTAMRPETLGPGARGELQAAALFALHSDAVVVSALDGTPSGMQAVYGTVVERAQTHGAERVVIFAPDPTALRPLEVRDWTPHPWCPEGLVVVEKKLVS